MFPSLPIRPCAISNSESVLGKNGKEQSAPSDFSSPIPPLSANKERYNIFVCFLSVTNTGNGKRYGLEIWLSCIMLYRQHLRRFSMAIPVAPFLGDCTAACRNLGSCAQRQQSNNKIWIWFCRFSLRPGYTSVDACWSFLEILCRIEFYAGCQLWCRSVCLAFKTTSLQRVPFLRYCDIIKSELESHLTCPTHKRACPVWKIGWVLTFFEIFSLNSSLLFSLLENNFQQDSEHLPCSRCEVTICRPTWRMQPLESILPHTHPA